MRERGNLTRLTRITRLTHLRYLTRMTRVTHLSNFLRDVARFLRIFLNSKSAELEK